MTIHWWRTEDLVRDLRANAVTERQSLWYAILSALIGVEDLYYAYWAGGSRGWPLFVEFVAVCVISVIGLHECFKANGGTDGVDFLKRVYCLGTPVGLKLAIASLVVGQAVYFGFYRVALGGLFRDPYFVYQLASISIAGAFTVFFYWRVAYHLARIQRKERSNSLMQPTGEEQPPAD